MPNFYVTFGQQYRHEGHPFDRKIHPDGYLKFEAVDYAAAREIITDLLGTKWSMMYDEEEFQPKYFPLGEIKL